MRASALDAAGGHTADNVLLQNDEQHHNGQNGQHGSRQNGAPVHAGIADKVLDGNLNGVISSGQTTPARAECSRSSAT